MNNNNSKNKQLDKTIISKLIMLIIIKNSYTYQLNLNEILELQTIVSLYINILKDYIKTPLNVNGFIFRYLQMLIHLNHIYPTPPLGQDMTQGQFLSGV